MSGARPAPRAPLIPARSNRLAVLTALLACAGGAAAGEAAEPDLTPLLDRLGRIAWLYADTALRFSCRETISVDNQSPHRYDYIYTHDEEGRFRDYRTRRGRHSGREVDMRREDLPRWFGQAYSWVFIFRGDRRERYSFSGGNADEALGRPAVRLEFDPVPPFEKGVNDWAGTALIDRETSQILTVEAVGMHDFLEHARFERAIAAARDPLAGPDPPPLYFEFETTSTEFGIVKNGMRFPSEVRIDMRRHRVPGHRGRASDSFPLYRVRQTYSDYRFFSVRTADEIRALLTVSQAPGAPP